MRREDDPGRSTAVVRDDAESSALDPSAVQVGRAVGNELVVVDADAGRDVEFAAFVRATSVELGRVAWYLSGDRVRAEDLLQTAYLRTWSAWDRVRDGDPVAYARRTLTNARTDRWRRSRREVLVDAADMPERSEASCAADQAERDLLVRALRTLPEKQRRVVVLRHLLGLPEAQVAADLGVSLGTVKSTASRGLQRLREELIDQEEP